MDVYGILMDTYMSIPSLVSLESLARSALRDESSATRVPVSFEFIQLVADAELAGGVERNPMLERRQSIRRIIAPVLARAAGARFFFLQL